MIPIKVSIQTISFFSILAAVITKHRIFSFFLLVAIHVFGEELYDLDHAIVGIYAVQSDTGEVIIDKNSDLSLMPASCMKIVTTSAALHLLGEEYRFETRLEYDGFIDRAGTLHGNISIRGGGDPCLGSERALTWKQLIAEWADAIQKLGIRKIEGFVIGDATKWEKALAVPSWNWEDIGNYYGAGACALSFHDNCYSLVFKPGNVGESASIIRTDPPLPLTFQNEVKTGPPGSGDRACIYGSEFSEVQCIRGTIPADVNEFAIKGAIPDPAVYCANLLAKQLQERGIVIEQKNLTPHSRITLLHTTYSPTVGEMVYWINQKSINLYAEHLLKKMGEVVYQEGSTAAGVRAVTDFWKSQGVDLAGFHMADGSGLSRKNLITTKQLVAILQKMKKTPFFPLFLESLPQRKGSIRAKNGNMSLVKGYAGYTESNIAFAILINQCPDSQLMNEKINAFLTSISQKSTR